MCQNIQFEADQNNKLKPIPVKAGQIIAQGFVESGDLVIVDKISYHFRKPTRGETFVFDTRNINEIHDNNRGGEQDAGSHYIKRCVGVPGDTLSIDATQPQVSSGQGWVR